MRLTLAVTLLMAVTQDAVRSDGPERPGPSRAFGIHVIDGESGRGIPLVELTTVHDVTWITDSAGYVALDEPQLYGNAVFLRIDAPGYEVPRDGFGMAGFRCTPVEGGLVEVRLLRQNIAERLPRLTGADRFRDSIRLGRPAPQEPGPGNGHVSGQDSVQMTRYRDRLYWFWGDTNRLSYPLGLFRTAGAVTPLPSAWDNFPEHGLPLKYFTNEDGFVRAMVDVPDPEGVVWIQGLCTVTDGERDRMVAHFSRRKGLADQLEQGLLLWNDDREIFEVLQVIPISDEWRFLRDHPILLNQDGQNFLMFGAPFPVTRVPATLEAIQDRGAYESWTCRQHFNHEETGIAPPDDSVPARDAAGRLLWNWRKTPPLTQAEEQRWLERKLISAEEASFQPADYSAVSVGSGAASGAAVGTLSRIRFHHGTVRWNPARNRWILIGNQMGLDRNSTSFLGEVFYSEAESPQGPFHRAIRIATHPGQSFYNPCHHDLLDTDQGRFICFEGTYCNTFTSSPAKPRYNYNQLMYRVDMENPQILEVFGPPGSK